VFEPAAAEAEQEAPQEDEDENTPTKPRTSDALAYSQAAARLSIDGQQQEAPEELALGSPRKSVAESVPDGMQAKVLNII